MAEIPKLQTTTFVMSDLRNFNFVGSILKVMLANALMDNHLIREYRSLPPSRIRLIPADLQQVFDVGDKMKRGGKRKEEASS